MLPAIPWLLLAEALIGLTLGPHPLALGLRLLSGAILWWALPGHLPFAPELALYIALPLVTLAPLLGSFVETNEPVPDLLTLTFPCLLVSALALQLPGARLVVLLWGVWAVWFTVVALRADDPHYYVYIPSVAAACIVFLPLLALYTAVEQVMHWESAWRQPKRRGRWPARQEIVPVAPRLPWLAALVSMLSLPPLGALALAACLTMSGPERRREWGALGRLTRVCLVVSWMLRGSPQTSVPAAVFLAIMTLWLMPGQLSEQVRRARERVLAGEPVSPVQLAGYQARAAVTVEVLGWALVTCVTAILSWQAAAIPGMALLLGWLSLAWLQEARES